MAENVTETNARPPMCGLMGPPDQQLHIGGYEAAPRYGGLMMRFVAAIAFWIIALPAWLLGMFVAELVGLLEWLDWHAGRAEEQ